MTKSTVYINGKTRKAFTKYGKLFVRCFYDIEVEEADKFSKKCDMFSADDSDIARQLVKGFNSSFGCPGDDIKSAGDLYMKKQPKPHMIDAINQTTQAHIWNTKQN